MYFFDPKVKGNEKRYLFQCGITTLAVLLVLLFLNTIEHTAIIAALGASIFVVFIMPKSYSSKPRQFIGGYAICILIGILCHYLSIASLENLQFMTERSSFIIFGSLSVGLSVLLMTITNTEHPPAAGIALGLILNMWDYHTILFIIGAVAIIATIKAMLEPILIDLM